MKVALLKSESFGKVLAAGVMAGLVTFAVSCKSSKISAAPAVAVPSPSVEPQPTLPPPPAPAKVEEIAPPAPAAVDKDEDASVIVTDGSGKGHKEVKATNKNVKPVAGKEKSHVVVKGDTLSKIAAKNGVTVKALVAANNMKSTDALRLGKKLEIPAAGAKPVAHTAKKATVTAGKAPTAKKVATTKTTKKTTKKTDGVKAEKKASDASAAPVTAAGKYVVLNGDNPPKIAKKLHVKVSALLAANGLTADTAKKLKIGQELVIPAGGEAPVATAPAGTDAVAGATPAPVAEKAEKTAAPVAAGEVAAPSAVAAGSFPHMVIEGDTLQVVADSYGVTVADIQKANPAVKSDADLKPNTTIAIPTK